jgi:hypothetical protein
VVHGACSPPVPGLGEKEPPFDKERGELTREGLKNFLKKMNVIFEDPSAEMQQDEFRYFAEEYDMKDKEQAVNL